MPTCRSPNPDHATDITTAAIKMLRYLDRRIANHPIQWTCRVSIHTGNVVGSVFGVRRREHPRRMEALSEPMRITVSETTFQMIKSTIPCSPRGMLQIKGADQMNAYFVETASAPGRSRPQASRFGRWRRNSRRPIYGVP